MSKVNVSEFVVSQVPLSTHRGEAPPCESPNAHQPNKSLRINKAFLYRRMIAIIPKERHNILFYKLHHDESIATPQ